MSENKTENKRGDFLNKYGIALILGTALLFKIILIIIFKYRLYFDVIKAVELGHEYFLHKRLMFITSKTYLSPMLWFFIYRYFGIWGLKIVNLIAFVLLFFIQYNLGKKSYRFDTVLIALFLFSFYVGTNLNAVAGEQDDFLFPLFFSLGILLYRNKAKAFWAGLLMGIGFLFKFSLGIFFVGFILFLLIKRKWVDTALSVTGMLIPFLCLNFIDSFHSFDNFLYSMGIQSGYSSWGNVIFKFFSTGIIFAILVSIWTLFHEKNDTNLMFFLIATMYPLYALINKDAFSASYIMMSGMIFFSFLIAEFLLKNKYFGKGKKRNLLILGTLIFYFIVTSMITLHNASQNPNDVSGRHSLIN